MKILCTKEEFAELVRSCQMSQTGLLDGGCSGCVFCGMCREGDHTDDEYYLMNQIEDICEIVSDSDG